MNEWESGLVEVKPGFYAYIDPEGGWFKSNTGIIDAGNYTVLIDTQYNELRMKNILNTLEEKGLPEPRIIINTHHHGDHVWTNHVVKNAIVVAHIVTARLIEQNMDLDPRMFKAFFPDLDFTGSRYTLPNIVYEGGIGILNLPNRIKVKLIYMGPAHTPGDTLVMIEDEGVAYTGDLVFYKVTPFALDGYLKGWIDVLEKSLLELNIDTFIPGHGPVTGKYGLEEMLEYLKLVVQAAEKGYERKLTPLQAALETDLGKFDIWIDRERVVGNIYRAYMELEGAMPAEPIKNIANIALDMISYRNKRSQG
ncbi:MAG: MBL fold metallo-hydrolase [Desulfurococcales archaeon]|nr:MBL fold metallo-hydrolase [Desulfurococcales archaeon]